MRKRLFLRGNNDNGRQKAAAIKYYQIRSTGKPLRPAPGLRNNKQWNYNDNVRTKRTRVKQATRE